MNTNYKLFQSFPERLENELDFNKVFKKYNNYHFFIIVNNNITFDVIINLYHDDSNNKMYFELSTEGFQIFSNYNLFKNRIKQDSQNCYQIITSQPSIKIKPDISSNKLIAKLKSKLEKIDSNLLSDIHIHEHTKKNKYINLNLTIYTPSELKNSVSELLQSLQSNNQEQLTLTQVNNNNQNNEPESSKIETIATYPIFQKDYKNPEKDRIKEVLKMIPVNKLQNLKLYKLVVDKDTYKNPIKTNFQNFKEPILYYKETDLPIIKQFLKKIKGIYTVRSIRPHSKKITIDNKLFTLSNKNKIIKNNFEYYMQLDGIKNNYLVSIDKNNRNNNKILFFKHKNNLLKIQKEKIYQTYQKLENSEDTEKQFNEVYNLFTKNR